MSVRETKSESEGRELFQRFLELKCGGNYSEFGRRAGVSSDAAKQWATGRRTPDRRCAVIIERVTEGEIPVESWDLPPRRGRSGRAA